jgi:hypothetical protein
VVSAVYLVMSDIVARRRIHNAEESTFVCLVVRVGAGLAWSRVERMSVSF